MQNASRSDSTLKTISRSSLVLSTARCRAASLVALAIFFGWMSAHAQAPPILNSPYVCANGITYTVTTCKPYRTDQWCETVEKQNGIQVTAMDSTWTSMTGRLQGCTNAGSAKPAVASPGNTASSPQQTPSGTQQTFNPAYLKEFPTVDQIMTKLKGSSTQDTAYRQLTALHEFGQMIGALAGSRAAQNQFTPDEIRILSAYFNAYTNLSKSTTNPKDAYAGDQSFTASLFTTFNMPTIQQLWQSSLTMTGGQQGGTQSLPATSDPSQLAARRCFELGGTGLQCVGTGMSTGFQQLMGINLSSLTGPSVSGLIFLGSFTSSSGLTLSFSDSGLDISNCGKMVQGTHSYSVSPTNGKYVLNIANQPQPLVISLGTDGRGTGPAAQDITGQQITGYNVTTNVRTGAVVSNTPVYGPITVHCTIGALAPGTAVAVDAGLPSSSGSPVLSALGTVLGTMAGEAGPAQLSLPPGPRMAGAFTGSGGLKVQFNDGNAVIDCAQAHVLVPYNVSLQGGSAVIAVKNGTSPFNLTVQASGSLSGSGTTTVNGKTMTAMDDNANPIFVPTSASCPVGKLTAAK